MNKESSTATTAQAIGVITAIDTKENILTLDHEAIPAINWPAMKMGFKVADPSLLNGLTVGDKVDFELKAESENQIIVAVKKLIIGLILKDEWMRRHPFVFMKDSCFD